MILKIFSYLPIFLQNFIISFYGFYWYRRRYSGVFKKNLIKFLSNYIPKKPGYIINEKGEKLGTHQGVMFYTIGQRKGLGIGGTNNGENGAWYVADKDISNNELIVVQVNMHPARYHKKLIASTNFEYCPYIKGIVKSKLSEEINSVLEIVIDGVTEDDIKLAIKVGILEIFKNKHKSGISAISAGNYGGKLGPYLFYLRKILR